MVDPRSDAPDAVLVGFKDRIKEAMAVGREMKWDECAEMMVAVSADCRASRTVQDLEGKKQLLQWLEKTIKVVRKNAKSEKAIMDILDRSNTSPEPPADPDVWSKPSPSSAPSHPKQNSAKKGPAAARREPTKSTSSMSNASAGYAAVEKADKSDRPANQSQSILPPNKNGEVFDASLYDSYIVQAVRATMELSTENTIALEEVIGMENVKQVLHEAVTLPLVIPGFFKGLRSPWKAMCLTGPPGTGKTLIARAIASESSSTFFTVSSTDLSSKWRGDSEKIVRLLFDLARFYAPSIIFIDEIDTLGGQRGASGEHEASRRVKSELLIQMDGAKHKFDERRVFVLAATNIPWELDEALRRRFEKRIFVPLPDKEARKKLIECSMRETKVAAEVSYEDLALSTEGFSGADVVSLCRAAAYNVLRRYDTKGLSGSELTSAMESLNSEPVRNCDFDSALRTQSSSVNIETMKRCKDWCENFGAM